MSVCCVSGYLILITKLFRFGEGPCPHYGRRASRPIQKCHHDPSDEFSCQTLTTMRKIKSCRLVMKKSLLPSMHSPWISQISACVLLSSASRLLTSPVRILFPVASLQINLLSQPYYDKVIMWVYFGAF